MASTISEFGPEMSGGIDAGRESKEAAGGVGFFYGLSGAGWETGSTAGDT